MTTVVNLGMGRYQVTFDERDGVPGLVGKTGTYLHDPLLDTFHVLDEPVAADEYVPTGGR
jgi:hypothetical protein